MNCGSCPFTDGMCYTSNPPKRKCIITGQYHDYDDECDCEPSRLIKEKEQQRAIDAIQEPLPILNDFGSDRIASSEYEFPVHNICEAEFVGFTQCIICGESIPITIWEGGPKVCDGCKKVILYMKDKYKFTEEI